MKWYWPNRMNLKKWVIYIAGKDTIGFVQGITSSLTSPNQSKLNHAFVAKALVIFKRNFDLELTAASRNVLLPPFMFERIVAVTFGHVRATALQFTYHAKFSAPKRESLNAAGARVGMMG